MDHVPSPEFESCFDALDRLLPGKRSISVAVAFVSRAGVELLSSLLDRHDSIEQLHVVARGAPVTDPDALLNLRDELQASVAVVAGDRAAGFHPKLWLLRDENGLHVISGSGNLTAGGLQSNREQFEIFRTSDSPEIEEQQRRFDTLTVGSIPLQLFEGSIAWKTWLRQLQLRAELRSRLTALDAELANSPTIDREEHKAELMDDLWQLYERTLAAKLKKDDGHIYNPSGFRLQLEGKRGPREPVPIAASICKRGTEGFDTILKADRPELTVEFLVVDPTKPYHDLFPKETRRLSAERLEEFRSWPLA